MNTSVDLRQLAIERGGGKPAATPSRRHLLTRYVVPLATIAGFLSLITWAARDYVFRPTVVTVVPVLSTTAEVRAAGALLFKAAGWVEPRPTAVRVAALAPGVVKELLVVEDQWVEAGEAVAELVKEDAQLAHKRAMADLQLRRAELDENIAALAAAKARLAQPVHRQAALGAADASLAKIQTQATNLPFELRRAEADYQAAVKVHAAKIAAQDIVAGVEIHVAQSRMESAAALVEELQGRKDSLSREQAAMQLRRDALRKELELLTDEIQARDAALAQVNAATARVELAEVAVAETQLQLERMTVRSPIEGRVYRVIAPPGARLGGGMQMAGHDGSTVVTLYQPEMLQVRVDVRFEDIPKVGLNQPVEIDNPALSSPLAGSVLFISSEADIQKNTLQVKVAIPDPPPVLKPEMLVDVNFRAAAIEEQAQPRQELRIFVAEQLVHQSDDGPFVWVADQSAGIARKTIIRTGEVGTNGLREVTSGLTVASRIISSGTAGLMDGDRIRVSSEDPSVGTAPTTFLPQGEHP